MRIFQILHHHVNKACLLTTESVRILRDCSPHMNLVIPSLLSECGGILTDNYGSITSPGYPGNYPPGRDCVWQVLVNPNSLITFTFGTLSLESHNDCSKDYLEVNKQ